MNTRSMIRTLARQVVPDTLLWRRLQAPFYRGRDKPEEGAREFTLQGPDSVFGSGNEIRYMFDEVQGQGVLRFKEPVWTRNVGDELSKKPMKSYSLLSRTAKMNCPSLSLPAGPPSEGGSCVAAGLHSKSLARPGRGTAPGGSRTDDKGRPFVCDLCYSLSGNYHYPTVATAQASRMLWIERLIASDPTGDALASALITAVDDFARRTTLDNLSKRIDQELGVYRRGQLWAPGLIGESRVVPIAIPVTELPEWTGYTSSIEAIEATGVHDGDVAGFFRIHDSGDLNVGTKLADWIAYLNAWVATAQAFPHVWFWLPTRTYIHKPMVPALQAAAAAAPNLVIRASALYVGADAPDVPGLRSSAVYHGVIDPSLYRCPVQPKDSSSCAQEGCRACWISDVVPAYEEH